VNSLLNVGDKLKELCSVLNTAPFKEYEVKYLHEYVECMKPVADSLDHLQGDKNCFMGVPN